MTRVDYLHFGDITCVYKKYPKCEVEEEGCKDTYFKVLARCIDCCEKLPTQRYNVVDLFNELNVRIAEISFFKEFEEYLGFILFPMNY